MKKKKKINVKRMINYLRRKVTPMANSTRKMPVELTRTASEFLAEYWRMGRVRWREEF